MAETVRVADIATRWGPAERAAIDRCAFLPRVPFSLREQPSRPPRLTRLIETEIIPRLMLTHLSLYDAPDEAARPLDASDVAEIAGLAMGGEPDAALEHVRAFFHEGVSLDSVILDGLAPAARLLGDMWRDDLCSFADVTIGMSRLQQVLRGLEPDLVPDEPASDRILLATVGGEQHGFGVAVLEGFFRRAGWDVSAGHPADELAEIVREEWFDVVGLSLSCDIFVDRIAPTIRSLRRFSKNKDLFVMVGGRYFLDNPDRAAALGADAVSSDARDALRRANDRRGAVLARC